ncbi:MAG: hypothetical protein LQ352_000414 [Teloschistes flavicans]|nr:MAG: hypothetical protein LQ352_000414 [Teloschistes flavicans]
MVTIVTTNASATGSTQRTNPQSLVPPSKNEIPLQEVVDQRQLESTGPDNSLAFGDVERWNRPHVNQYRLAAIEKDYDLSYTVTSLVFLSPFAGYTLAAIFSDRLHLLFGRRGIALLAPICKVIAYVVIATHPSYPAVVTILALAGFGNGITDAAWNAWIGQLAHANQLLGLMHGLYGLGATISPLIATTMITKGHLGWWTFFYLMTGLAAVEIATGAVAFWSETGTKYTEANRADGKDRGMIRESLKQRVTWICAMFLLCYVGLEVSLGGWIVNFMIRVRKGEPFQSGMTATGFWLGITAGRVVLGFITPKVGERLAVSIYLLVALGFELIFWLVPQFVVSAVAVALLGFFIGPIFPSTIVAVTKLLPSEMHVAAIGFSAAIGGGGAAVLPFAVGAIAQAKGPATLQPIILALIILLLAIWLTLPRIPKHVHQA